MWYKIPRPSFCSLRGLNPNSCCVPSQCIDAPGYIISVVIALTGLQISSQVTDRFIRNAISKLLHAQKARHIYNSSTSPEARLTQNYSLYPACFATLSYGENRTNIGERYRATLQSHGATITRQ